MIWPPPATTTPYQIIIHLGGTGLSACSPGLPKATSAGRAGSAPTVAASAAHAVVGFGKSVSYRCNPWRVGELNVLGDWLYQYPATNGTGGSVEIYWLPIFCP
ncbi:MAG: hypothetical protein JJU02_09315 [Cryomorphaceae bacterium]|nr:hypothetical protein [Cryomorphaceae bacterium]